MPAKSTAAGRPSGARTALISLVMFVVSTAVGLALAEISNKGMVWSVIGIAAVMAVSISQGSSAKFIYFDF